MARQGPQDISSHFHLDTTLSHPTLSEMKAQDIRVGPDPQSHLVQPAYLQVRQENGAQRDEFFAKIRRQLG